MKRSIGAIVLLLAILGIAYSQALQPTAREGRHFVVTGAVNQPGRFELHDGTRVMDSLNLGGGFREYADRNGISIVRGAKRYYFNYEDHLKGKNTETNILLEDGDVIVVPR